MRELCHPGRRGGGASRQDYRRRWACHYGTADVAGPAAVEAMVARTEQELGVLTILVKNAGVSWQGTLDNYDPEQVARMRRINVEGVIQ